MLTTWIGTIIIVGAILVFLWKMFYKPSVASAPVSVFPVSPVSPAPALTSVDSIECLRNIVLSLDEAKDTEKIDFLLKEIGPVLINPRK